MEYAKFTKDSPEYDYFKYLFQVIKEVENIRKSEENKFIAFLKNNMDYTRLFAEISKDSENKDLIKLMTLFYSFLQKCYNVTNKYQDFDDEIVEQIAKAALKLHEENESYTLRYMILLLLDFIEQGNRMIQE